MSRAAFIFAALLAAVAGGFFIWKQRNPGSALLPSFLMTPGDRNMAAFLALIRELESNNRYDVIAGGDTFADFSEHPYVLDPQRAKPLGTTASGAYQQVKGTWIMARDALGLKDFSPESQDAAARWIVAHKIPGQNQFNLDGTGLDEIIRSGDLQAALEAFAPEWEAFAKILQNRYHVTLADAEQFFRQSGGTA